MISCLILRTCTLVTYYYIQYFFVFDFNYNTQERNSVILIEINVYYKNKIEKLYFVYCLMVGKDYIMLLIDGKRAQPGTNTKKKKKTLKLVVIVE